MAVIGPPGAAGGRMGAARRGRCPAPLRCIEGVYRRYSKTGATLAGISVRANLGDQDPFRDPQRITARAWPAQITIICMAARLHRLDPAAAHSGGGERLDQGEG
jgi:hypothetical protein